MEKNQTNTSNQQLNSYLGSNFWKVFSGVVISLALNGQWFWRVEPRSGEWKFSDNYFKSAADAEQDLITFLKNYEGFRNG